MAVRETLAKNTMYNGMGRLWEAIVGLALTAYIVSKLGAEGYGLWSVAAAFTGYAALMDVGLGSTYSKFVAQFAATKDWKKVSEVVTTGLFFYLFFGLVFIGVTWGIVEVTMPLIASWAEGGSGDLSNLDILDELKFLLRWGLVLFAASMCIAPFTSVQTGLQRMGVTNLIAVPISLVKIGGTVYFLENGFGIRGLIYANGIVLAVFGFLSVLVSFRICRDLRVGPRYVSRDMFRTLFGFGWQTQVSRLANLVMFETDILVITFLLQDLRLAGLYRLGVEIVNKMRQIPVILLSALVPAVSQLDAQDQDERIRDLYQRSTKYIAVVTFPLAALLIAYPNFIMNVWQGPDTDWGVSAWVIRLLALGYVANILPGAGVTVVLGKGRPDIQMKAGLISMFSNIFLTVILALSIGFWGIPLATALSMSLSWIWFLVAMRTLLDLPVLPFVKKTLTASIVASVPVLLFGMGANMLSGYLSARWEMAAGLLVVTIFCAMLYLGGLRRTGVFDAKDMSFFRETLGLERIPGFRTWSRFFDEPDDASHGRLK